MLLPLGGRDYYMKPKNNITNWYRLVGLSYIIKSAVSVGIPSYVKGRERFAKGCERFTKGC